MVPFLTSAPRRVLLPMLLAAGALCAGAAQAGGVQWSVGIQLPAPPVVYYPAPPQRVYAPAPVYVRQEPQVIYVEPQRPWPRHHHHRHWRDEDRWEGGGDNRWDGGRSDWRHGR
jgi:hypothetical protein